MRSGAQVLAKVGEPRATGEVQQNGERVKSITYVYASTGGVPLEFGVIPAKAMAFYFHQDKLVGQEFLSSFKDSHTNFDDTKVSSIEKGKTTRTEVIQLMGKPSATFIAPMVKQTTGEAIGYTYQATSGSPLTGMKFARKGLRVSFDSQDKVLEVDFSSSGTQ